MAVVGECWLVNYIYIYMHVVPFFYQAVEARVWAKATVCCHDNGEHSSEARRRVDVDNGAPSLSMLSGGGDIGAGICRGYREGDVPPRHSVI